MFFSSTRYEYHWSIVTLAERGKRQIFGTHSSYTLLSTFSVFDAAQYKIILKLLTVARVISIA